MNTWELIQLLNNLEQFLQIVLTSVWGMIIILCLLWLLKFEWVPKHKHRFSEILSVGPASVLLSCTCGEQRRDYLDFGTAFSIISDIPKVPRKPMWEEMG